MATTICILVYILGFILCYNMQRVEIESSKEPYTIGDRVVNFSLSLLSFLWVLIILITSWVNQISVTGYWDKPVTPVKPEPTVEETKTKSE